MRPPAITAGAFRLTTMSLNATCLHGNNTTCRPSEPLGAVAGGVLVPLLLLVGVSVGAVFYVKRRRSGQSSVLQLNSKAPGKTQKANGEQPKQRAILHQYTTVGNVGPVDGGQSPIYENFSGQASQYMNPMMRQRGPEDDLYLQCDSVDDAIYSNDPACSLTMLPEPHEDLEDVYIIPDAL